MKEIELNLNDQIINPISGSCCHLKVKYNNINTVKLNMILRGKADIVCACVARRPPKSTFIAKKIILLQNYLGLRHVIKNPIYANCNQVKFGKTIGICWSQYSKNIILYCTFPCTASKH